MLGLSPDGEIAIPVAATYEKKPFPVKARRVVSADTAGKGGPGVSI
jgi:hypothetical protein